jgi:hypothetical protein
MHYLCDYVCYRDLRIGADRMKHIITFTGNEFLHLLSVIHLNSLKGDVQSINLYRKLSSVIIEDIECE